MRSALITLLFVLLTVGCATPRWPSVSDGFSAHVKTTEDIAIVISIEEYAFLPNIPGASQTADDWERFFLEEKGVKDTFVLKNKNASLEEMLRFIDTSVAETTAQSTLWFVFVGHGSASAQGKDGLLIGMDAQRSQGSIEARSLSISALKTRLLLGRQKQTVAILDSCFSGKTDSGVLVKGAQPVIVTNVKVPPKFIILSAAKGDQIAGPLPTEERPAFSYLLLGGLRGWADRNEDNEVTSGELIKFTQRQLRRLPGRQQTPILTGAEDVILTNTATEVDPGIRRLMAGGRLESQERRYREIRDTGKDEEIVSNTVKEGVPQSVDKSADTTPTEANLSRKQKKEFGRRIITELSKKYGPHKVISSVKCWSVNKYGFDYCLKIAEIKVENGTIYTRLGNLPNDEHGHVSPGLVAFFNFDLKGRLIASGAEFEIGEFGLVPVKWTLERIGPDYWGWVTIATHSGQGSYIGWHTLFGQNPKEPSKIRQIGRFIQKVEYSENEELGKDVIEIQTKISFIQSKTEIFNIRFTVNGTSRSWVMPFDPAKGKYAYETVEKALGY